MVNVVFCVKVNALGLFVDGHDRQPDINGAMELPLGDLEWRVGGRQGTGLRFPEAQSHHLLEATQDSQAKHRKSYMKGLIHHLEYTEHYAVPNFMQV